MTGPSSGSPSPAIGDVLYIHDRVTHFSRKNVMRWCMVAAVTGPHVRVVGRSASSSSGVFTPAGTLPEFDLDGRFWPASRRVSLPAARKCRNIGLLPEPYRGQVLAQYQGKGATP